MVDDDYPPWLMAVIAVSIIAVMGVSGFAIHACSVADKATLGAADIVYRDSDPEKLRDHMQGQGRKQSHAWSWKSHVEDINDRRCMDHRGYWIGKRLGVPKFDFWSIVVIPHAHLDMVTKRVIERCLAKNV